MNTEMKRQDFEELSQLLRMYDRVYGSKEAKQLLLEVAQRYSNCYKEDILLRNNPRNAGRKKKYTETDKRKIRDFREKGFTFREIAEKTGCSVGYIQGVMSDS